MWAWYMLALISLIISVIFWLWNYVRGDLSYWTNRNVPFLDCSKFRHSLIGRITPEIPNHVTDQKIYDEFKKLDEIRYGGIIQLGTPVLFVMDLELVKHIMIKDFDNFVNRDTIPVPGQGKDSVNNRSIMRLKDQEWREMRSALSPTFTTSKIRRMYENFNSSSKKMVDYIRQKEISAPGSEIDVRTLFERYAFDVISTAGFGLESQNFGATESEFSKMLKKTQTPTTFQVITLLTFYLFPRVVSALGIRVSDSKSTDYFRDLIRKTIQERQATGVVPDDFLQLLLEIKNKDFVKDESNADEIWDAENARTHTITELTENTIVAQCLLFFFSGFDATNTFLIYAAYEIAINPEIQEHLFQEILFAYERNNTELSFDLIMKMEYLDKVVCEVLRKYPPAFRTTRVASNPYEIPNSGVVLDKGTSVVIPVYAIHHDEEYYPDPELFDPERFSPENKGSRNPYAYMPFGLGPRNCVAMRFGLAEGKAALAHLVLNFRLEPVATTPIPMRFSKTEAMKPEEGALYLSLKAR